MLKAWVLSNELGTQYHEIKDQIHILIDLCK